jgi:hypothetical protein
MSEFELCKVLGRYVSYTELAIHLSNLASTGKPHLLRICFFFLQEKRGRGGEQ